MNEKRHSPPDTPVTEPAAPLAFSDMAKELTPNGESAIELAMLAVNGLILYAAETTAQNIDSDIDGNWPDLVKAARSMTERIVHTAALDERVPVIDFMNEFDAQADNASEYPEEVIDVSPEHKEAGLRGLAWYARELIVTAGLDCEPHIKDAQNMMSNFTARWDFLQPPYNRFNDAINAELDVLRTEAEKSAPGLVKQVQRLRDRLAENYAVYKRDTLDLGKEGIFYAAAEIFPVIEAYEYFSQEHRYRESEINFLLKFENPLEFVSDRWAATSVAHARTIEGIFADQERTLQKGGYTLMPDDPDPAPNVSETPQKAADTGEKLSVMERIRQAAKDAKEQPHTLKDSPGRKKPGQEL